MKKLIITLCAGILFSVIGKAQPTISSSVLANKLVCIGSPIRYKVDFPTGLSSCSYSWRIKTGETTFTNTNTTNQTFDATCINKKGI